MKTALFVDAANLYYVVGKRFNKRKIDYSKLKATFEPEIAYVFGTRLGAEAKSFIDNLKQQGYVTKFIQTVQGKTTSLNVDIAIAAINVKPVISHAIFATTDRDLIPLYNHLRDAGITVHVVGCGLCKDVKYSVDGHIEIDKDLLEDEITKSTSA